MSQPNWAHFIAMQAGVVPISFGTPGEAKTAIHRALASKSNRRFLQVILSQKLREDVGGVPVPTEVEIDGVKHRCVHNLLPEDMVRAMAEPSVLLLDELNQASHDVLGAAQEIINNPPAGCWMSAVCNPVEQSTAGQELSPPVVNRCCILQWESLDDTRRKGWESGFAEYPLPELPVVGDGFLADHGVKWGNLLLAFEKRRPEFFHDAFPKDVTMAADPWCSPRSWHNTGLLMAACDSAGGNDGVRAKLATGCVGDGPATEFLNYVKQQDLPDPAALLDDPSLLRLPATYHLASAIMGSVVGECRRRGGPEDWESGIDVLENAFDQQPEVAMSTYGAFVKIKPASHLPRQRDSQAASELKELITGIREVVQAG